MKPRNQMMKRKRLSLYLLSILSLLSITLPSLAVTPPPPKLEARSYFMMDFHSGKVLADHNADQRMPPASLTKIMTVYAVLNEIKRGNLNLDDQVTVSKKAWKAPGSRMFIEVDKRVPVEELLKGVIVQSGNDASIALAEHIAGDERTFAELMNQHAQRLGMTNTHFVNSTGLPDPDHYTTAHDLTLLTQALIAEFPEYYPWFRIKQFTYNDITQHNRNRLLWRDPTVDGVKTGHTEEAGYCLVASAKRDEMRLISTVMGTDSDNARASASQALLNYGFRFFTTRLIHDPTSPLREVRIYKGALETLPVGVARPIYVTVPKERAEGLSIQVDMDPWITAPISKGQELGTLSIRLENKTILESPVIALQKVPTGGLVHRVMDEGWLLIEQWRNRPHE